MEAITTISLTNFLIVICGLLTFLLLIGLTCFSGGLVRAKNTNDIFVKTLTAFILTMALFSGLSFQIILSPGQWHDYLPKINLNLIQNLFIHSQLAALFLQMVFALMPFAILIGITAERLRFWPFFFFSLFMLIIIYPLNVFWVWGDGFLRHLGFIDIGGASVLHLSGATAGAIALLYLGSRKGRFTEASLELFAGANLPLGALGLFLIIIGSIASNIGAVSLNQMSNSVANIASVAFNTCIAGSCGALACLLLSRIIYGIVDMTLLGNGLIAGIVAISAAPLSPNMATAAFIGFVGGILCLFAIILCAKLKIDDPIGAIASHGVGAVWGLLAVVISHNYQFLTAKNFMSYEWQELLIQLCGIATIFAWTALASLVFWTLIRYTMGLRIKPQDEYKGLDILNYGVSAYSEFIDSEVENS